MAMNTNEGRVQYEASSGQTAFDFNFAIFENTDLLVYNTPTGQTPNDTTDILIVNTDYTVTIDGTDGGQVVLVSPATLNDVITIVRSLPIERNYDYQANGDLYADTLDSDQEYQTYLIQDGDTLLKRSVTLPQSYGGDVDLTMPPPVANGYFKYNAAGTAIEIDATIYQAVASVGGNIQDVVDVASNISNINTVADSITNVNTVANNSNNINTVADNNTNINTIVSNIGDINSIVDDISNIDKVANNITDINTFADTYFISDTAPSSPTEGDLWFDTSNNLMKVYGNSGWTNAGSSVNGTSSRNTYTATSGQTNFSATYDAGYVDVYVNGLKLQPTVDFTATNGTTVVLASGANTGDIVDIVAYGTFELADHYTKTEADSTFMKVQYPEHINSVPIEGGNVNARMCVSDGSLYVTEYSNNKILVMDLSNPESPNPYYEFNVAANPRHVEVIGRHLFVCCLGANKIEVYDIQNSLFAYKIGEIATGQQPKMFRIVGNNIYVACYLDSKVEKYTFQLPNNALSHFFSEKVGEVVTSGQPLCLDYNGSDMLLVGHMNTADVDIIGADELNITDTLTVGTVGGMGVTSANGIVKFTSKTQAMICNWGDAKVYSVNCENPYNLSISGSCVVTGNPEEIQVVGNYGYVPSLLVGVSPSYVDIIDLHNTKSPINVGKVELTVNSAGFTAVYQNNYDCYLYVNGHAAPFNIDVLKIKIGEQFEPYGVKKQSGNIQKFTSDKASICMESFALKSRTSIGSETILNSDTVLRVIGGTQTLPDPSTVKEGLLVTIMNVSSSSDVLLSNTYNGINDLYINPYESVTVQATEFGGVYQWDMFSSGINRTYIGAYVTEAASTYYITVKDDYVRIAGGQSVVLNNPASMGKKRIIIKNAHPSLNSSIINAFAGYSGTLKPGESIELIATYYDGVSQWDLVSDSTYDSGWQPLDVYLQNSWVEFHETLNIAYRKIGNIVHLRGLVKNGTASTILALPAEIRPPISVYTTQITSAGISQFEIDATGSIKATSYSAAWTSIACTYMVD